MTTLFKLTDKNMQTYSGFQWELNEPSPELSGEGKLCGPGFYHAYLSPELAVLLNPIHAGFDKKMRLFECEGSITATDGQLKIGCRSLTLTKELKLPSVTTEQRVKFAILCAKQVYKDPVWNRWADNWLSGKDKSGRAAAEAAGPASEAEWAAWAAAKAAKAAAAEAEVAAWAAAKEAEVAAAEAEVAAWAAAKEAEVAARAAARTAARAAAEAGEWAAEWAVARAAAEAAEWAAAWAAEWAAGAAGRSVDLITLAKEALQ